ncbi:MAG: J domain-containing protein [Flavobacteriales bacterium]|nr:J domain-containing protein [Flavobacteriales bacterium]
MINYYTILGISSSARGADIKEAYRKKALLYHPDVNDSPEAKSKFQTVNEAYVTLNDPVKREKFDIVLEYGFHGIKEAIKREKASKHKDPAYSPKSDEFMAGYYQRKNRPVKKDKLTIIIENILYASMVIIALVTLSFAYLDLILDSGRQHYSELFFFLFWVGFVFILVLRWKIVLRR